ncbi:MAG: stage V sporulation protein E [Clostridium sp.]
MKKNSKKLGKVDFILVFIIMLLVAFGVVMVYSASSYSAFFSAKYNYDSYYLLKKQAIWAVLGTMGMVIAMQIDYHKYKKWIPYVLGMVFIMLVAVFFFPEVNGAHRWIGIGGASFQPSEIAKYSVVMYIAIAIDKKGDGIKKFLTGILPILIVVCIFAGIILMEPNMSIACVIGFVTMIMLFVAGIPLSYFVALAFSGLAAIFVGFLIQPFRVKRLFNFSNPWGDASGVGYQLVQSLIALGSGGIFGVGLGQSRQKCFYIPEAHNDFIFAIIGEELGLIGCATIIALYVIFILRGIRVSVRAKDTYGSLLALGITSIVAVQAIINIAVVSGSMPVTGVPLPFISYGGSALIFNMFAMGILLNISRSK